MPDDQAPDYHFMILAPGLQSAWFFQAARRYWQRFQPILTDNWDLLRYIPSSKSVAVTVLARPDTAVYVRKQVKKQREDIQYDPVVTEDLESMETILNQRTDSSLRFSVED
jgi:hypothetical protein